VFTNDKDRYSDECKEKGSKDKKKQGSSAVVQSEDPAKPPLSGIMVELAGIGVNVLTAEPKDFLYLTIDGIKLRMLDTETEKQIEASINRIQVDNNFEDAYYPVILAGRGKKDKPWFQVSVVLSTQYDSIMFFEYFSFLAQDIVVNFETGLISKITDFTSSLPKFGSDEKDDKPKKEEESSTEEESKPKEEPAPAPASPSASTATEKSAELSTSTTTTTTTTTSAADPEELEVSTTTTTTTTTTEDGKPKRHHITSMWEYPGEDIVNSQTTKQQIVYFRLFHLNPLKIVVSLSSTAGDSMLNLPPSPMTVILETLLDTVANLEEAPLCFNSLYMENPFVPMAELQSRIIQHYIRQGIQQVYKLLGSTEALGNPVGLFSNISTGVMDFFSACCWYH